MATRQTLNHASYDGLMTAPPADTFEPAAQTFPRKRADAQRNEQALLDAAAAVFVASGVDAPVRDIAAAAGVGMGTIYRHFPTRADLIIAVYRHQVDACADAGPALLASGATPHAALTRWIDLFVDFLITKHGLAAALHSDQARFQALHAWFLDRLVPVCAQLLDAAAAAGEIRPGTDAFGLLYAVGNLCAGTDPRYDARRMTALLIAGLRALLPLRNDDLTGVQASFGLVQHEPGDGGPRRAVREEPAARGGQRHRAGAWVVGSGGQRTRVQHRAPGVQDGGVRRDLVRELGAEPGPQQPRG
jgi:AcrR family transcriptional regulator